MMVAWYFKTYENDNSLMEQILQQNVPMTIMEKILRYPIAQRCFRLFLLHENETVKQDITQYVLNDGTLEKTYQQGQTRSLSINLLNPQEIWNPSPVKGKLFANTKFKLQMGIKIDGFVYWIDEGVFVCKDPQLNNSDANKTVSIELFDKFALLDGTISGTTEADYEIPVGTNLYKALRSLLRLPKDNLGNPYDSCPIVFPMKYMNEKVPYTIQKTANNSVGEIIIDLANCLSCDVFYDEIGRLTFRDNLDDLDFHNRNTAWNFKEENSEFGNVSRRDEWSKIKNRYIVKGCNINGMQFKGVADNTAPSSAYNINGNFGIHPEIIEDNLIYSNNLCLQRAKYELKKNLMRNTSISFECRYLPHINPNDLVRWTFKEYNYINQPFVVNSVSIPLNSVNPMSLSITNITELPM